MDAHDRPNRIPWPPILLLLTIAIGLALQWLAPLPWIYGFAALEATVLGGAMIVAAFAIDIWAALVFRSQKTTIMPHQRSASLVTRGPFRFSRNPIYVGNLMVVAGLGLVLSNLWLLIVMPLLGFALHKLAIEREERHLEALFADQWQDYKARVRRWI
ncbi:MAG TPA: isoprenylcysteine carboxylmethyltransferase family protein [Afifellaceae bacterium]|nr:isoprenylcysteine carboxylmethyltransferase family protein [Afifellaceae bacterium]